MPLRGRFTPRLVRSTNKRLVVICITHYRRRKSPRFGTIELAAISQQGDLPGSGFPGGATSGCEQSQQTEPYSIVSSASVKSKCPCGLEVDQQLELRRSQHRQLIGLGTLENAPGILADLAVRVREIGSIADQAAIERGLPVHFQIFVADLRLIFFALGFML